MRVARDGEEALRLADAFRPDVVILDVMMPLCDGLEVCRRLRGRPRAALDPDLMLTARGATSSRARTLARRGRL